MNDSLVVDDLTFTVRRSDVRRTIGITVERDGSLSISAPQQCAPAVLEQVVRNKQGWVYTKLAQKDLLFPRHSPKEFVPGEGFYYLGRSYRLRLVDVDGTREVTPLCLHNGRFELLRSAQPRAYTHFREW